MKSGVEQQDVAEARALMDMLRQRRQELGLPATEVSRRMGHQAHNGSLSMWERNQHAPTLTGLVAWARALGLEIDLHEVQP